METSGDQKRKFLFKGRCALLFSLLVILIPSKSPGGEEDRILFELLLRQTGRELNLMAARENGISLGLGRNHITLADILQSQMADLWLMVNFPTAFTQAFDTCNFSSQQKALLGESGPFKSLHHALGLRDTNARLALYRQTLLPLLAGWEASGMTQSEQALRDYLIKKELSSGKGEMQTMSQEATEDEELALRRPISPAERASRMLQGAKIIGDGVIAGEGKLSKGGTFRLDEEVVEIQDRLQEIEALALTIIRFRLLVQRMNPGESQRIDTFLRRFVQGNLETDLKDWIFDLLLDRFARDILIAAEARQLQNNREEPDLIHQEAGYLLDRMVLSGSEISLIRSEIVRVMNETDEAGTEFDLEIQMQGRHGNIAFVYFQLNRDQAFSPWKVTRCAYRSRDLAPYYETVKKGGEWVTEGSCFTWNYSDVGVFFDRVAQRMIEDEFLGMEIEKEWSIPEFRLESDMGEEEPEAIGWREENESEDWLPELKEFEKAAKEEVNGADFNLPALIVSPTDDQLGRLFISLGVELEGLRKGIEKGERKLHGKFMGHDYFFRWTLLLHPEQGSVLFLGAPEEAASFLRVAPELLAIDVIVRTVHQPTRLYQIPPAGSSIALFFKNDGETLSSQALKEFSMMPGDRRIETLIQKSIFDVFGDFGFDPSR